MDLKKDYAKVTDSHGPFTAHNFNIPGISDGYTLGDAPSGDDVKVARVNQIVADYVGHDLAGKRVLDIACLEGIFGIELALRGAHVTAVDIREPNIEKARFAARAAGVEARMEFLVADMLDIDPGEFDIVLCLGIFYHFDRKNTFPFAEKVMSCVRPGGLVVIDTFVSALPHAIYYHAGEAYYGNPWVEHLPWTTARQRVGKLWQSLHYNTAVYLTRDSVARLFVRLGCTSFSEMIAPGEPKKHFQRKTFVGVKGTRANSGVNPWVDRADQSLKEHNLAARFLSLFARHG